MFRGNVTWSSSVSSVGHDACARQASQQQRTAPIARAELPETFSNSKRRQTPFYLHGARKSVQRDRDAGSGHRNCQLLTRGGMVDGSFPRQASEMEMIFARGAYAQPPFLGVTKAQTTTFNIDQRANIAPPN
jgi:hypothetical protein